MTTSMTITIQRTFVKGEITEGRLLIDGQRVCDTLENSFSCLEAGTYDIKLAKCKQYARKMILVNRDSPRCPDCPRRRLVYANTQLPRPCPQLKPGNGVHNRHDGSILVGTRNCLGCIIHPRAAFNTLYDRIRKNIERGREVTLKIEKLKN